MVQASYLTNIAGASKSPRLFILLVKNVPETWLSRQTETDGLNSVGHFCFFHFNGSLVDTHQRRHRSRPSSSHPKDCPVIIVTSLWMSYPTYDHFGCTVQTTHHILINSTERTYIINKSEALDLQMHLPYITEVSKH